METSLQKHIQVGQVSPCRTPQICLELQTDTTGGQSWKVQTWLFYILIVPLPCRCIHCCWLRLFNLSAVSYSDWCNWCTLCNHSLVWKGASWSGIFESIHSLCKERKQCCLVSRHHCVKPIIQAGNIHI